jgi:nitrate reductase gamma subunit
MTTLLYVAIGAGVVLFVAGTIARALLYARAPIHLRWELYPVPHEEPHRVKHGGSYFETVDWWTKPLHFSLLGELKVMVPEMLFLKALWEHNRPLWYRSFPFHFGLYLVAGALILVLLTAVVGLAAPAITAGAVGSALRLLYSVVGIAGLTLGVVGALALLHRRLTDPALRNYTTAGDVFNLAFFVGAFGLVGLGFLLAPAGSPGPATIAKGLLTLDAGLQVPGILAAGLIASALLVAYIPATHMSHFVAKYFTYHSIRWNDAPNERGGAIEAKLVEYLTYRPTWSAKHVGADGVKTWADVAMTNPTEGAKK